MRRAPALALATAILTAVAGSACAGRAGFDEDVTYADVERALGAGPLHVCDTLTDEDGIANQALDTRTYFLSLECARAVEHGTTDDESVRVLVDRFDDVEARDAAARQFEVLLRPRGDGAVWTWGPFTLFANGARDDDVMEQLTDSLDRAGAS